MGYGNLPCNKIADARKIDTLSGSDQVPADGHGPDAGKKWRQIGKQGPESHTAGKHFISAESIRQHTTGNHENDISGKKSGKHDAHPGFIPAILLHDKGGGNRNIHPVQETEHIGEEAKENGR